MVQQSTKSTSYDYTANGLVPIQGYIRQLQQQLVQQEWDGEYDKAEITQRELSHVMDYQEETGSLYYPMF